MGNPDELKKMLAQMQEANGVPKEQFLRYALEMLKNEKPNDRSELDRRYAICITELEKVVGYYVTWIVMQDV